MVTIEGKTPAPWRYSVSCPGPNGHPYGEVITAASKMMVMRTDTRQPGHMHETLLRDGFRTGGEAALARAVSAAARHID